MIKAKRYLKEGLLTIDEEDNVLGSSDGPLSSLDLAEPLYIGGIEGTTKIAENIGLKQGLSGCLYSLVVGGKSIPLGFSTAYTYYDSSYDGYLATDQSSVSSVASFIYEAQNPMVMKSSNVIDCSENICIRERPCDKSTCVLDPSIASGGYSGNGYRCNCPLGYTGKGCRMQMDDCGKEQPCIRNTRCIRLPAGGFSCVCEHNDQMLLCSDGGLNT